MSTFNPNDHPRTEGDGKFTNKAYAEPDSSVSLAGPTFTRVPFSGVAPIFNSPDAALPPWPEGLDDPQVEVFIGDTGQLETTVYIGEDGIQFWGDGDDLGGITSSVDTDEQEYPDFGALSEDDREAVLVWGKKAHDNATNAVTSMTNEMITAPATQAALAGYASGKGEPEDLGPYAERSVAKIDRVTALYGQGEEPETTLKDILADLRHYADKHELDFEEIASDSFGYYNDELEDDAAGIR